MAPTVLIGGALSGKSALAVEWGGRLGEHGTHVATEDADVPDTEIDRLADAATAVGYGQPVLAITDEAVELRGPWDLLADPEAR